MARQTLNCTNALNGAPERQHPDAGRAVRRRARHLFLRDFFDNQPPAACTPTGPRASGSPCTFNGQCMSGSCNGTKTSVCGTCGAPPAAGADCSDSTCADGDRCVAATTECQLALSSNGACDSGHPVRPGPLLRGRERQDDDHRDLPDRLHARRRRLRRTTLPGCDRTRGLYCGGPERRQDLHADHLPRLQRQRQRRRLGRPAERRRHGPTTGAAPPRRPAPRAASSPTARASAASPATATRRPASPPAAISAPASRSRTTSGACDTTVGPGCMFPARCVVSGGDGGTAGTCLVPDATIARSS